MKKKFLQIIAGTARCMCNEKMEQSSPQPGSLSPMEGGTEGILLPAIRPEILLPDAPVCIARSEINA